MPSAPIRGATAVLVTGDGRARRVVAPALDAEADAVPFWRGDRRGWHALLEVPAVPEPLGAALLVDGRAEGTLRCAPRIPPLGRVDARIVICMATFEPDPELFARQIASIEAQSAGDWHCVICDDASSVLDADLDERFTVVRNPDRVGVLRNFERALEIVGDHTEFVALADQDDIWHADKLARLVEAIGDNDLAWADARVVDRDGRVLRRSFFGPGAPVARDLDELMIANTVPGAGALLRRRVLERALPFPEAVGPVLHDHWLALVACATGGLRQVDEPLWDYVQHEANTVGHFSTTTARRPALAARYAKVYRDDVLRMRSLAATLALRTGTRVDLRGRRLLARALRTRGRPGSTASHGAEADLVLALLWRRLALGLPAARA